LIIPISKLRGGQPTLPDKVAAYREAIRSGMQLAPIEVIYSIPDDVYIIQDGHHRATAYSQEGILEVDVLTTAKYDGVQVYKI
jgi:ParB-like chromosome segregation protein Spo0J